MKRISTLLMTAVLLFCSKAFSQCTVLGCAANYDTQSVPGNQANFTANLGGCFGDPVKAVYWEFFFSQFGGDFDQTFTPTSNNGIELDWTAYDAGITAPATTCPIDPTGWIQVACNGLTTGNLPTGPGVANDPVTTTAGHYYAVAIVLPPGNSTDGNPFTFTVGTPRMAGYVSLGCAANKGTITIDGTQHSPQPAFATCSAGPYKQIFWQYFLSTGGDYTQTFTPAGAVDLDWVAFDIGTTLPSNSPIFCPLGNTWTEVACDVSGGTGNPTGPGAGAFPTTAGHYYAIGVFYYQNIATSFTIGDPQIGGAALGPANCFSTVLPVNLSSFDAKTSGCSVDLTWTAATETNFKDYEAQYSTDGSSFQTIATVDVANSKNYSYQHANPAQGKIYYRLKMVDLDGSFEYSRVIALNLNCNRAEVVVYPNPVTDKVNINITNAQSVTIANLYDNAGKLVYTSNMTNGTNSIDMTKFTKGMYLLVLKNNFETQNLKIIKQ